MGSMSRLLVGLFAACALVGMPAAQTTTLVNANVIDMRDGSLATRTTIVIERGTIRAVGGASPPGARVIDLDGKFVIPGLWDMHVHGFLDPSDPSWVFPLLVANGVTGMRDMGSLVPLPELGSLRDAIEAGRRVGPHVRVAGPVLDSIDTHWKRSLGVAEDATAASAVQVLKRQGADFVKIYPMLKRHDYLAVVKEATRLGLAVAGQVPDSVGVEEASNAGQRSFEHLDKIMLGCSAIEREATVARERALESDDPVERLLALVPLQNRRMLAHPDPQRCDEVLATLARNGTWVVPALVSEDAFRRTRHRLDDPRLAYLPLELQEVWEGVTIGLDLLLEDEARLNAALEARSNALIPAISARGVAMLAGTNAGAQTPFVFPGFSMHDELARLVAAGVSPLAALQAATWQAARFFGEESRFGLVAPGRAADLVVLDANPLERITNTQKIAYVVLGGRVFDRVQLDMLLDALRRTNRRAPREELSG